jgi:hypothetical protein
MPAALRRPDLSASAGVGHRGDHVSESPTCCRTGAVEGSEIRLELGSGASDDVS